jgi:tetratricopeptide (TPR) repeat protein
VVTLATVALFQGRFEEGERLMDEALALGEGAQRSDAVLSYRIQRFTLARECGGLEEIEETIQRSLDEYPARPMFRCMLASLYADLGREREAREVFESLAAGRFGKLPVTNEWLFSLGFLVEVASFLGDLERAETLYELLLPYSTRNASTADYIATGSVSRYLGVLASTMSRWGDAERHFEDAVAMNGRIRARPSLAHAQEDYARMLVERGRPDDREKHRELLTEALKAYRELGMDAFAAKVSRSLRRLPSRAARARRAPGRPAG